MRGGSHNGTFQPWDMLSVRSNSHRVLIIITSTSKKRSKRSLYLWNLYLIIWWWWCIEHDAVTHSHYQLLLPTISRRLSLSCAYEIGTLSRQLLEICTWSSLFATTATLIILNGWRISSQQIIVVSTPAPCWDMTRYINLCLHSLCIKDVVGCPMCSIRNGEKAYVMIFATRD